MSLAPLASRGAVGHPLPLDSINQAILHLLAHQGRCTMREIAQRVGRTESTIRDRVSSLEQAGILLGFTARIDWGLAGLPFLVVVEGNCLPREGPQVLAELQALVHVEDAILALGAPNVIAFVRTRELGDARKLLVALSSSRLRDVRIRVALQHLVPLRMPNIAPMVLLRATPKAPAHLAPNGITTGTAALHGPIAHHGSQQLASSSLEGFPS